MLIEADWKSFVRENQKRYGFDDELIANRCFREMPQEVVSGQRIRRQGLQVLVQGPLQGATGSLLWHQETH